MNALPFQMIFPFGFENLGLPFGRILVPSTGTGLACGPRGLPGPLGCRQRNTQGLQQDGEGQQVILGTLPSDPTSGGRPPGSLRPSHPRVVCTPFISSCRCLRALTDTDLGAQAPQHPSGKDRPSCSPELEASEQISNHR